MLDYNDALSSVENNLEIYLLNQLREENNAVQRKLVSSIKEVLVQPIVSGHQSDEEGCMTDVAAKISKEQILGVLRYEARAYLASSLYEMPFPTSGDYSSDDNVIRLFNDDDISLNLFCKSGLDNKIGKPGIRHSDTVMVSAKDTLLCFYHGKGSKIRKWQAEPIGFDTAVRPDMKCQSDDLVTVEEGLRLFLPGGKSAFSIESIEDPIVGLSIELNTLRSPVNARYNMVSGLLSSVSAADKESSKLQLLAPLLRKLAHRDIDVEGALSPLLHHRDYFVRWTAMREILDYDPSKAHDHLDALLQRETHPQVIKAAEATKKMLG